VLETFFLDAYIKEIVKASFNITELEEEFYSKYTTLANIIYLEKEPSVFAKNELGFPLLGYCHDFISELQTVSTRDGSNAKHDMHIQFST
jgi:hypothetical protein